MLIHGNNSEVLSNLRKTYSGKINLMYIDPPFSTKNIFRISKKRTATISMSSDDAIAYKDTIVGTRYFELLRERLIRAYDLLSDQGSLYVHIDCKVAYEVKNILDEIFGPDNFRNSISGIKSNPKNFSQKGYGSMKDTILFYTKSDTYIWNPPRIKPSKEHLDTFTKHDEIGAYTTTPLHAPGETKNGDTGKKWHGKLPPVGRHWRYPRHKLRELDKKGLIEWSSTGNPRLKIYAKDIEEKGVWFKMYGNLKIHNIQHIPLKKIIQC